jgi:hypothetical protein
VNEEAVDRRTSRLPPRGDRGDDQVAYAHEIASEVGGRESAIGRDDRREMITGAIE